jgi:biopolymer transport protein ExbD
MKTPARNVMMRSADMDLKPFMNLMVVLIPMLLLSAEFARVAVIDIKLPDKNRGSGTDEPQKQPFSENKSDKLLLTAIITDSAVTLGAKGGFLPSIPYREFHRYIARDDHAEFTVEYRPGGAVVHPSTGRMMSDRERSDILLYSCDEGRTILNRLYNRYGELITNAAGAPLASVGIGDSVYTLSTPRRLMVVSDPATFTLRPLSTYDDLQNRLMQIKERYSDAVDRDAIIIAAENGVIYDKIVRIMDKARSAQYPDISISKLRS